MVTWLGIAQIRSEDTSLSAKYAISTVFGIVFALIQIIAHAIGKTHQCRRIINLMSSVLYVFKWDRLPLLTYFTLNSKMDYSDE